MTCVDGHATAKTSIVMHHAVSDLMTNWSDARVCQWFSSVGRNRGYKGIAHSYHCDPTRSYESFSQAQYCLHPYNADGNKYGWRLTQLIYEPFRNACWHASNWTINKSSIGIETAGNYLSHKLDRKALMLVADTFRYWDKNLGGGLQIYPHKKFAATACPGMIAGQIPDLIDMFNNPAKWNDKLWPTPDPEPDNLYRVLKAGKQIGAYKVRDNAFDKWYTEKADKITFNGTDVTYQFKAEMNTLEKKIQGLEMDLDKCGDEKDAAITAKTICLEASEKLKEQIKDLNDANNKNLQHIEDMKAIFGFTGGVEEFKHYLEEYKSKCEEDGDDESAGVIRAIIDWLKSLWPGKDPE